MPATLNFVAVGDEYPPDNDIGAAILGPLQQIANITFIVENQNVYFQLAKLDKGGSVYWDEVDLPGAVGNGGFSGRVYGIKFKNATPGLAAVVSAIAYFADDAIPFQVLQSSGSGGGGSGTIEEITSSSLIVTNPFGPITDIESDLEVTDGSIVVQPTNEILVGSGMVLTNPFPGIAELSNANGFIRDIFVRASNGGFQLVSGVYAEFIVDFAATIKQWTLLGDQNGTTQVDIWKTPYGSYPPTVANSIVAGNYPAFTSTNKGQDSTLTGWTTSINPGDTFRININSITSLTRLTLILEIQS